MSKLYDLLSAMCGKIKKPDWNQNDPTAPGYVKNRPFYQDTVFDITWDGNTEGLDAVEGIPFYKVSGTAPEKNDISGSEIVFENDGVQEVHKADDIGPMEGENCVLIGEFAAIVYAENATLGRLIFPTPGVWFLSAGTQFTRSLKKTILKTLHADYLPEIPVDKLPEIPVDKLPEIASKTIPVIEIKEAIYNTIGNLSQQYYTVKNLSYAEMLEIFNSGICLIKDGINHYYSPARVSVNNGSLFVHLVCASNSTDYSGLAYVSLVCLENRTQFFRDLYYKISAEQ